MRRISFLSAVFCFLILSSSFFGCSKKTQSKEFTLKEDLSIGVEYGDERFMFAGIGYITLDSEDNIYVLDWKNFRIQKFDKDGNFLKSLEVKKGAGPQEVTYTTGMAVTEKGKIFVHDRNSTKILIFGKRLEFLRSFKIGFRAMNILPCSEENVIVLGLKNENIFHVYSQEGKLLQSFGEPFDIPSQYSKYANFPFLKLAGRASRSRSGKIYIMNPHKFEIRVYEENEVKRVIKHESEFFSSATVKEYEGGEVSFRFPGAFALEHKNRLYVTLQGLDEDAGWQLDIFENDEYIASLEVNGLAFAVDQKGRLYFSEEEEFPRVVRYSVELKQ